LEVNSCSSRSVGRTEGWETENLASLTWRLRSGGASHIGRWLGWFVWSEWSEWLKTSVLLASAGTAPVQELETKTEISISNKKSCDIFGLSQSFTTVLKGQGHNIRLNLKC
jgi:hypothetical protein